MTKVERPNCFIIIIVVVVFVGSPLCVHAIIGCCFFKKYILRVGADVHTFYFIQASNQPACLVRDRE